MSVQLVGAIELILSADTPISPEHRMLVEAVAKCLAAVSDQMSVVHVTLAAQAGKTGEPLLLALVEHSPNLTTHFLKWLVKQGAPMNPRFCKTVALCLKHKGRCFYINSTEGAAFEETLAFFQVKNGLSKNNGGKKVFINSSMAKNNNWFFLQETCCTTCTS